MAENENTKVNSNDGNIPSFSDTLKSLGRKRKETPSEKIMKLALDRDKAYDKVFEVKEAIKTATENKEDYDEAQRILPTLPDGWYREHHDWMAQKF